MCEHALAMQHLMLLNFGKLTETKQSSIDTLFHFKDSKNFTLPFSFPREKRKKDKIRSTHTLGQLTESQRFIFLLSKHSKGNLPL